VQAETHWYDGVYPPISPSLHTFHSFSLYIGFFK